MNPKALNDEEELEILQARALEEGIPYQTFAASLLHKFVSGHLVDHRG